MVLYLSSLQVPSIVYLLSSTFHPEFSGRGRPSKMSCCGEFLYISCSYHECHVRAYDGTWSSSFVRRSLTNPLTFSSQCWCFWSSDKLESSIELTVDLECHSHEQKRKLKGTSCLHKLNPLGCIKARPEHVAIALRETERLR